MVADAQSEPSLGDILPDTNWSRWATRDLGDGIEAESGFLGGLSRRWGWLGNWLWRISARVLVAQNAQIRTGDRSRLKERNVVIEAKGAAKVRSHMETP